MSFYVLGSKEVVDVATESNDSFKDAAVLFEADELDSCAGYITLMIDNRDSEIYNYKHIKVVTTEGIEKLFYFQYAWLPKSAWIRLNPPPAELKELVKTKGEHYRAGCHQRIQEYIKNHK
jgi:hypothetical protein